MTIRCLVIAALLAGAGAAHADTITPSAPSSSFVSGWTTGNGTDVLGSGVLQGNLNLIGGVAYTSGASANLADALYGKVASTIGSVGGETRLFFQRGIEANYLLASGHGILAATAGMGKSVVGTADGAMIMDGVKGPTMAGGGNSTTPVSAARVEASAVEVPEPSSVALMLLGMMGAGAITRRRR